MTVNLKEEELKAVSAKLDLIRLEILRLRASLLPEEELTQDDKKQLRIAIKELNDGKAVHLSKVTKRW